MYEFVFIEDFIFVTYWVRIVRFARSLHHSPREKAAAPSPISPRERAYAPTRPAAYPSPLSLTDHHTCVTRALIEFGNPYICALWKCI